MIATAIVVVVGLTFSVFAVWTCYSDLRNAARYGKRPRTRGPRLRC